MVANDTVEFPPLVVPKKLRRVLIDCSFVDFSRQPTGIPRVVLKYIETGFAWGELNGVEVVPVVPAEDGLYICRPVPGHGAPRNLLIAANTPECVSRDAAPTEGASLADADGTALLADLRKFLRDLLSIAGYPKDKSPWYEGGDKANVEDSSDRPTVDNALLTRTVRIECGAGDLMFCPAYWHDVRPKLYQDYSMSGAKIIILVHDVLPIAFPRFYNAPWCYEFKRNVIAAFSFADAFCTVSDYTRHGLGELKIRERLRSVPIMTTYNGFEPLVSGSNLEYLSDARQLPDSPAIEIISDLQRYYVMVGSIEPKKGHIPVIECFEEMWRAGFSSNLVIIGRKGWLEDEVVKVIEKCMFYQTKLFWFSGLDDFELGQVYSRARALVFSSLGEGFGIPMIEAAAYGIPVIAYDTPIVREILGDAAQIFTDAQGFIRLIVEMEQEEPRTRAAASARNVAWPSWEEYTPRVFDTLRSFFEDEISLPYQVPRAISSIGHS